MMKRGLVGEVPTVAPREITLDDLKAAYAAGVKDGLWSTEWSAHPWKKTDGGYAEAGALYVKFWVKREGGKSEE